MVISRAVHVDTGGIATHAEVVPVQRVVNFGQEDLDVELSLCVAVYFFIMTLEYCQLAVKIVTIIQSISLS